MSYYPDPNSHIREKARVMLKLANYANLKELEHNTSIDTSDLAFKKNFLL